LRAENPHSKSSATSVLTNGASTGNILSTGLQVWSKNLNDMPPALSLGNSFSNRTSKVDSTITLTYNRIPSTLHTLRRHLSDMPTYQSILPSIPRFSRLHRVLARRMMRLR
jgi:hypothetical protein